MPVGLETPGRVLAICPCYLWHNVNEGIQTRLAIDGLRKKDWQVTTVCVGAATERRDACVPVPSESFGRAIRALGPLSRPWCNLPNGYMEWLAPGLRAVNEIVRSEKPDIIYSRSMPIVAHLIARSIALQFGIPWVAHLSDPWGNNPYLKSRHWITRSLNTFFERRCLPCADLLTFTTREAAIFTMRSYRHTRMPQWTTVPNVSEADVLVCAAGTDHETPVAKVRLIFAGSLYGLRSPVPLYKGLALLKEQDAKLASDMEIHFYGQVEDDMKKTAVLLGVEDMLRWHDSVAYDEMVNIIAQADVALHLEANLPDEDNVFFPSKLADYLVLKKPIAGICSPTGSAGRVIREAGGETARWGDVEGIAGMLRKAARCRISAPPDGIAREYCVDQAVSVLEKSLRSCLLMDN